MGKMEKDKEIIEPTLFDFTKVTTTKKCLFACPEYKVKSGQCDCINQMKNQINK